MTTGANSAHESGSEPFAPPMGAIAPQPPNRSLRYDNISSKPPDLIALPEKYRFLQFKRTACKPQNKLRTASCR